LERQATDTDARGNWVRDVWVPTADGAWVLVSETLVREGAASAAISAPNTRFAAWLEASQAAAESEALGLWGNCDTGAAVGSDIPLALRPGTSEPR
ncbi:MAG TPA: thermonuclease family protein, partial [Thermomicrobiales bacterium]|nr:thermonuclease family protein [Thermomicrobiales bacterium]